MQQLGFKQSFFKVILRKTGSLLLEIGVSLRDMSFAVPAPVAAKQSERHEGEHLALVAGYFSFEDGYATFGDTEAMRVTCEWLKKAGIKYDIACHHLNGFNGVSLVDLDPARYDVFVFVCGPWKEDNNNILERFDHCVKVGVNLSIEDENSNKFDLLYPRDLPDEFNPDLVFSAKRKLEPLIGVCLVHPQAEYGNKQRHHKVKDAVENYLLDNDIAYINLDTLYRDNNSGVTDAKGFENILARLDVVISSRLHGMVFSLKNETPVVAIDAIAGGAKLTKQAEAIDWPVILASESISSEFIADAVDKCLKPELKQRAMRVKGVACDKILLIERKFIEEVAASLAARD